MLFLEKAVDQNSITSVVAIPTANRPEILALSLERLANASNRPEVHIYADDVPESHLREIETVRDLYLPEAFLFRARPHVKAPSGCWNILNALKTSSKFADNVYLVEEDVFVYPYFFDWHQKHSDAPVSCGRKLPRYDLYTNPGTCFRRPLLDALIPHICDEYFQNTDAYCRANFQEQFISTLDDGLIRRVLKQNGLKWGISRRRLCALTRACAATTGWTFTRTTRLLYQQESFAQESIFQSCTTGDVRS